MGRPRATSDMTQHPPADAHPPACRCAGCEAARGALAAAAGELGRRAEARRRDRDRDRARRMRRRPA
jgi:hypothetical protein